MGRDGNVRIEEERPVFGYEDLQQRRRDLFEIRVCRRENLEIAHDAPAGCISSPGTSSFQPSGLSAN